MKEMVPASTKPIVVKQKAYEEMMDFAKTHPNNEVIGILFGTYKDDGEEYCIVESAIPMRTGSHDYVEFNDSDYETMGREIKNHDKLGQILIGWFHSHPFGGQRSLFMSKTDRIFHANAMRLYPKWIALVLDPHRVDDRNTFKGIKGFVIRSEKRILVKRNIVKEIPIKYV